MSGEITTAKPGLIKAGSWKHNDLPPPVGSRANTSLPARTSETISCWNRRKDVKPKYEVRSLSFRNIPNDEDPLSYVLGYTCVNDVTARDLQRKDVQFTRGKSFDTFCPVGPWIETDVDPGNVAVETRLNGEVKQKGNTADMAFPVPFLIRYISEIMTLYPGDLIATGTPAGV